MKKFFQENQLIETSNQIYDQVIGTILSIIKQNMHISKKTMNKIIKRYANAKLYYCDLSCMTQLKWYKGKNVIDEEASQKLIIDTNTGITDFFPTENDNKKDLVCYIRSDNGNPEILNNTIYHEVMHVISAEQLGKYSYNMGFRIVRNGMMKYDLINECMTELITKYIYDEIYQYKYRLVYANNKCSIYARPYFMISYLLLNRFESNPTELFEMYINSDIKGLGRVLYEETGMTLDDLENKLQYAQNSIRDNDLNEWYIQQIEYLERVKPINNQEVKYQCQVLL